MSQSFVPPSAAEWDATAYHRLSDPQFGWGLRVLNRLALRGDERVLDVGCGSGRLTAELLSRLPRGEVVALDASENMARASRATLAGRFDGGYAVVRCEAQRLPFAAAFDVVFSTATFHWIADHPQLFRGLHAVLRPGGRLCAQCGGGPNLERLHARATTLTNSEPFASYFVGWAGPWEFADHVTTAGRLRSAGFEAIETGLEPAPITLADAATFREFVRTVVVRPYLARLPNAALHDLFLDTLTTHASRDDPPWTLDYWRLNISAVKAPEK